MPCFVLWKPSKSGEEIIDRFNRFTNNEVKSVSDGAITSPLADHESYWSSFSDGKTIRWNIVSQSENHRMEAPNLAAIRLPFHLILLHCNCVGQVLSQLLHLAIESINKSLSGSVPSSASRRHVHPVLKLKEIPSKKKKAVSSIFFPFSTPGEDDVLWWDFLSFYFPISSSFFPSAVGSLTPRRAHSAIDQGS